MEQASDVSRGSAPLLSAVAIMRDEAANLPGLIANLRGVVDELVLVDDGSTDESPAIAEAAAPFVRMIRHPMNPETGFAGLRNAGIEAASGAWLLHMDCDERLTPELAEEIGLTIAATSANALSYRRLNYFLNRPMRHGGWDSWNCPQLARKGCHRFENALHERCVVDGAPEAIGQLRARMLHLNEDSYEKRLRKSEKYVAMEVRIAVAGGRRASVAKIAALPLLEFVKKYVLKRGFLDGVPGLISAIHSATARFRIEALLWDEQNRIPRSSLEARATGIGGGE
jgi:(heptosyl)LPS beta-1,4-glucosyltransferase